MFESSALGAMSASRSNMPPAPIEGSCAASPIATSFDAGVLHDFGEPVEAVGVGHARLVEVDRRVLVDVELAALARATTSASSVSVCPASAGLSWPRRCAVDPDTAIPSV